MTTNYRSTIKAKLRLGDCYTMDLDIACGAREYDRYKEYRQALKELVQERAIETYVAADGFIKYRLTKD